MELSEHDRTHLGMMGLEDFGSTDVESLLWEAVDELGNTDPEKLGEDRGKRLAPKTRSVPSGAPRCPQESRSPVFRPPHTRT